MRMPASPTEPLARFIVTGDTHLGFDLPLRPRSRRPRRGEDFFRNFEQILKYALEVNADYLIHGGDLFFRSKVPAAIVDLVYGMLGDYAERGLSMLIVPGNHERSVLPLSLYRYHSRINILEKPGHLMIETGNLKIAFGGFPAIGNGVRDEFPALLQNTGLPGARADLKILCFHEAVEGAQVGPGNFTFRNRPDTIRLADFPDELSLVLSGHIHRAQVLRKKRRDGSWLEILYPGSVERTSFAEKDEQKGFWELEIYSDRIGKKFHPLPARPMLQLSCPTFSTVTRLQEWLTTRINGIAPDSIVRLRPQAANTTLPVGFSLNRLREIGPETLIWEVSGRFYNRGEE